jgi:hypothetical protein
VITIKRLALLLLLFGFSLGGLLTPDKAVATGKSFPKIPNHIVCPNPPGQTIASYNEGWHWIVGYPENVWGSDVVTKMTIGTKHEHQFVMYFQCYCPTDSSKPSLETGIQTIFIPAASVNLVSGAESWLLNQGFQAYLNGADFNLDPGPIYYKNMPFDCDDGYCPPKDKDHGHKKVKDEKHEKDWSKDKKEIEWDKDKEKNKDEHKSGNEQNHVSDQASSVAKERVEAAVQQRIDQRLERIDERHELMMKRLDR